MAVTRDAPADTVRTARGMAGRTRGLVFCCALLLLCYRARINIVGDLFIAPARVVDQRDYGVITASAPIYPVIIILILVETSFNFSIN